MSEQIQERLLHIGQVSAWIGISENTLRYWRQVGSGPPSARIGRRVVYREAEVKAWIDAHFDQAGA